MLEEMMLYGASLAELLAEAEVDASELEEA